MFKTTEIPLPFHSCTRSWSLPKTGYQSREIFGLSCYGHSLACMFSEMHELRTLKHSFFILKINYSIFYNGFYLLHLNYLERKALIFFAALMPFLSLQYSLRKAPRPLHIQCPTSFLHKVLWPACKVSGKRR